MKKEKYTIDVGYEITPEGQKKHVWLKPEDVADYCEKIIAATDHSIVGIMEEEYSKLTRSLPYIQESDLPYIVDKFNKGEELDVEDEEIYDELNIAEADLIISLLPNIEDNYILLNHLNSIKKKKRPMYIATVNTGREGFSLFSRGADYVVVKSFLEADHIQQIQSNLYDLEKAFGEKKENLTHTVSLKSLEKKMLQDKEYAQIVHNLSKLRLAELKKQRKAA